MLRKSPGFTAIALITLAIGIGANTIMFSMSDLLLLQPKKVKNPRQLAFCAIQDAAYPWFAYSAYLTIRDSHLAFCEIMAQGDDPRSTTLVNGDSVWQVRATYVSADYFPFLGIAPVQGRGFLPEEERLGSAPVVVLSHHLWQRLGSDPKIVGQVVTANGVRCQVVGVAPDGFTGASLIGPDLWLPLGSYLSVAELARGSIRRANASPDRDYPGLYVVGRLKPGVNMAMAQSQLQALVPRFKLEYPKQWRNNSSLKLRSPGRFTIENDVEQERLGMSIFSLVLMTVSIIILLIACLNLANMLIVYGASRNREIAVRMAIGSGRLRIVRQLLVESLLLAFMGGVIGILLAFWGTKVLNVWIAAIQDPEIRNLQPTLNVRVLAATLGFCLVAMLLFGLRPALLLSKRDIVSELKESASSVRGHLHRKRSGLSLVGQIALAVMLVLSATLLTRSAVGLARPDPRFALEDKLVVQIDPLSGGYDQPRSVQACKTIADHLASLPDVKMVGMSTRFFFGGGDVMSICEYTPGAGESGSKRHVAQWAAVIDVGRDYFTTLEIPLLQGRLFDRLDSTPHAEKVAIIDESLAHKLRPDGNALGCLVEWGFFTEYSDPFRVVGIVANVPGVGDHEIHAQMYKPVQADQLSSYIYLRAENQGAANVLEQRIRQEIHRVDPRVPLLSVATLAQKRRDDPSIWLAGFGARLALAAGIAALFLATMGIYAIKSYMVASRTSEIGIRMALGATHGSIMGMVLREELVLTIVGLIIGIGLGLSVAKVSASMLYSISPIDPVSIIVTVGLLGAASLLASYIPARRAAKIDPMEALRYE